MTAITERSFRDLQPLACALAALAADSYDASELRPTLRKLIRERRRVLHVIYHGNVVSFVMPQAIAINEFTLLGGGSRIPLGVVHRLFFQVPYLIKLAQAVCNPCPQHSFDGLLKIVQGNPQFTDIGIYPEGGNALHSDGRTVQEFKSPRFIELALRAGLSLCLGVYTGAEAHSIRVPLPETALRLLGWLPYYDSRKLVRMGVFPIPALFRMRDVRISARLYVPDLSVHDLVEEESARRKQLWEEAHKVRAQMQQMLDRLRS